MFAVKGWSVDSSLLKPQTAVFSSSTKAATNEKSIEKSSRKRKRQRRESLQDEAESATVAPSTKKKHSIEASPNKHMTATDTIPADVRVGKKLAVESPNGHVKSFDAQPNTSHSNSNGEASTTTGELVHRGKAAKKKNKKSSSQNSDDIGKAADPASAGKMHPISSNATKLTPMQAAMRQKLVSARFRHLNETLYTSPSRQAQELFDSNPEMFEDYHSGFRQQVAVWPENPVDKILSKLRRRGLNRPPNQKKMLKSSNEQTLEGLHNQALPRTHGTCIIADCGCGDARLAQTLTSSNDLQQLNLKIHSYDLHSSSKLVTKADMTNLPLTDGSVDVVVFCLALMGTNWISFIEEAYRVLHWKGELWVAEIKSRFARPKSHHQVVEHSVGNKRNKAAILKSQSTARKADEDEADDQVLQLEVDGAKQSNRSDTDIQGFVDVLRRRGFLLKEDPTGVDHSNKMFVSMEFVKAAPPTKGKGAMDGTTNGHKQRSHLHGKENGDLAVEEEAKILKPCLYKIR